VQSGFPRVADRADTVIDDVDPIGRIGANICRRCSKLPATRRLMYCVSYTASCPSVFVLLLAPNLERPPRVVNASETYNWHNRIAVRQIGVSELTYYRWRKQYGGMSRDQLRQLKELRQENERLRKAVSDLTLDKLILSEAARGNF